MSNYAAENDDPRGSRMLNPSAITLLVLLALAAPVNSANISYLEASPFPGELYGSYMGIDMQEITPDRVGGLKLKEEHGAEITMVDHDSPAGKAGLREHDVILDFNGTKVEGVEQLRRLIHETPPGRSVKLTVSRDGQPLTINVQLADKKKYFAKNPNKLEGHELAMAPMPPLPPMPVMPSFDVPHGSSSSGYGLLVDSLTPQLGDYFGVRNGEGVLVKSVEKGSPADHAGFRAGDVIVKIGDSKVADRGDWRSATRGHRSGKINVGIVRDHREQNLTINLPESTRDRSAVEVPDFDFEIDIDFSDLEARLRQLEPELERAQVLALEQSRKAMDIASRASQKALAINEKKLEKALKEAQSAFDHEMKRYQKELEKAQREQQEQQQSPQD
jgi:serine protease Do